jgi:hypothetical protein
VCAGPGGGGGKQVGQGLLKWVRPHWVDLPEHCRCRCCGLQAVYTALKETEQRATDLLPFWKVSLILLHVLDAASSAQT